MKRTSRLTNRPKRLPDAFPNSEMNPYDAPTSLPAAATSRSDTGLCPVCGAPVRRLALAWPVFRCQTCSNRLIISGSRRSRNLSILTILLLVAGSYIPSEQGFRTGTYSFGAILIYAIMSTFWLHLFGRPKLKAWFGQASPDAINKAREAYLRKTESDAQVGSQTSSD
ncbi:hypothetical protein K227x_31340 [Rubripirellula lacrimiformis]|uniref:DUF983 domain-containing protein n=1 Tax=Rubripirellula lacrimiformis TaxID=1930273 RepID=A0A517NC90_9BACT|nr:hypothetical protein K227x_31340 [Rubripirellula lacrimiformis]